MPYLRKLPSGSWHAVVRLPNGDRVPRTHKLKSVVRAWAEDLENDIRRGDWIDPRNGDTTVGDLWERFAGSRRLELASRRRDESHWRCHVAPHWARTPVGSIVKPDVSAWVVQMEQKGTGAATIEGALGVLRSLLEAAVDALIIRTNPARGVKPPRRNAHLDRVLAQDEDELILSALGPARLFGELLLFCGLRWEEAAAVDREHVNQRRHIIHVGPVVERDGTIRPYPKSRAGVRDVPVDDDLWPRLRDRVLATEPGGLLFTTFTGRVKARKGSKGPGPLSYPGWRARVWLPALKVADLEDPQPTPHDLRHTYGTRLAEQGVPPHEIMAVMGHERLESVQRYLHAGEDRFDRVRQALGRGRGNVVQLSTKRAVQGGT